MKVLTFRHALAAALLAGLTGVSTSCKDYLDVNPDAYNTSEAVFSSVSGATTALIGVYDLLSGDNTYGTRISMYWPYDSDEMIGSPGLVDNGRRGINRWKPAATNADIINPWDNMFQGIERANICIKNIPAMALYDGGSATEQAALHRLHGEALTLRAQFFYELVRNFGDVPAQFVPSVAGQDFNVPHADRNATLDRILVDLLQAEGLVPWRSRAGAASERITKGAVKALRARIALQRGGYSANSRTGVMERAADYQTYYLTAKTECKEIMDQRGTEHELNPSFLNLFKTLNGVGRDNEVLFDVGMSGNTVSNDSKVGYYNGPRHISSPTFGNSSGAILAVPTYFYAFDSTDTRRDVTVTPFTYGNGNNPVLSPLNDQQYGTSLTNMTDGKFRRSWHIPALPGGSNYLGYNWPLIRFADVLLMYAEAENELNGPAAATAALLDVRTRAFGGDRVKAAAGLDMSSKQAMFGTVANERLLEFGGEGIRKYDLLRWNLLEQTLKPALNGGTVKSALTDLSAGTGRYADVPLKMYYKQVNGQVVWLNSFYRPAPATAPVIPGVTVLSVNWRQNVSATYLTNLQPGGTGLASEYMPRLGRELLPIPQTSLDTDPVLRQNFGY